MIQSANVMNRGAGSDTQGYALPKFITDVSLGDRAHFKRASTPMLLLWNRKWVLERGEHYHQMPVNRDLLSASTPILKKTPRSPWLGCCCNGFAKKQKKTHLVWIALEEKLKKDLHMHKHTWIIAESEFTYIHFSGHRLRIKAASWLAIWTSVYWRTDLWG